MSLRTAAFVVAAAFVAAAGQPGGGRRRPAAGRVLRPHRARPAHCRGTKAGTQVLSHAAKVVVYGGLLGAGQDLPYAVVLAAIPLSVLGTAVGGRLLDRLTDASFASATRWVVTAIGVGYLTQAALAW